VVAAALIVQPRRGFAIALAVAVAFLICSATPLKTLMIGGLFYGLLVVAVLWAAIELLRRFPLPGPAVLALGAALFIAFWRPDNTVIHASDPALSDRNRAYEQLSPVILGRLSATRPTTVFVSSPGPIIPDTIAFAAMRRNLQAEAVGPWFAADFDAFAQQALHADIIVATENGAVGQQQTPFPTLSFGDRLIAAAEATTDFAPAGTYTDPKGKRTTVFVRRSLDLRDGLAR